MRGENPCDGRPRVTESDKLSSGSHSVRVGRRFLALLLVSRTVGFGVGCGPAAGSLGGECQDNGCNASCDGGLQCDNRNNTCIDPSAGSIPPSPPCSSTDTTLCPGAAGTQAYLCTSDASPDPWGFVDCAPKGPLKGETLFCCTPHPGCERTTGGSCEGPSVGFLCTGSATPDWDAGQSLCASYVAISVFTGYCCVSEGECFGAISGVQCAGFATPYYCAGSATPPVGDSGVLCTPVKANDGGDSGLMGYCCQR